MFDAILVGLWKDRLWLFLSTILGIGLACGIGWLTTPIYKAEVILSARQQDRLDPLGAIGGQLQGIGSLLDLKLAGGSSTENVNLALLTSRGFTESFIDKHKLLPELFSEKWDARKQAWHDGSPGATPTPEDAFRLFDEKVRSVVQDRRSGLILLGISWKDRSKATDWANQLVADANEQIRMRAIQEATGNMTFLNKELSKTEIVGVREAIYRLLENNIKSIMVANIHGEYAFEVVDAAHTPDADNYIWPNWILLAALGALGGFGLSAMFLIARRDYLDPRS